MESSLDYYQQNQENKQARRELFLDDPMGCYVPEPDYCLECGGLKNEDELTDNICDPCLHKLKDKYEN